MRKFNKIMIVSGCCLLLTIILGFIGFPGIVKFVVRDQTALRKRNLMKKFYLKLPMPMDFRIYFFNISNPSEVQQGGTPVLKEIGPYCYDAYKEKIDVTENAGEDSLTYTPYETYFFNQERSGNLTHDDYVTILNPLIVGMVNLVAKQSPPLLKVVNKALKSVFQNPENIYLTTKVRDILFEGITINCNVNDFAGKAVCSQIKSQVPGLVEVEKRVYKFSVLGPRNGTLPNRFKILRGIKKSPELGRVVEVNHQKETKIWSTKRCNRFKGTDGWIFPPFINKEVGFSVYSTDVCRNMHMTYISDESYHGVFVEKYFSDLGDMSTNPAEKCYCPSLKTCLPKGILDLTKCMGVPIYATLPHFLRVDKNVRKGVRGLKPVTDDHIIKLLIQPLLGVPMVGFRRLQLNLPIQPNQKIDLMKTLPDALHPIFWLEEGIMLEGTLLKMIQTVFIALKIFDVVKYCFLALAVGGLGFGSYLYYKEQKSGRITPFKSSKSVSSSDSYRIIRSPTNSVKQIEETNNNDLKERVPNNIKF